MHLVCTLLMNLERLLRSLGGFEANFLELCFGRLFFPETSSRLFPDSRRVHAFTGVSLLFVGASKGTTKKLYDKDFVERSGELSGAICIKNPPWWTFRLRKKNLAPPKIPQLAPKNAPCPSPSWNPPPPSWNFRCKTDHPPPLLAPRTPPSPSPSRKK